MAQSNKELLRRISTLAKHNQDLTEENEKLNRLVEKLRSENEAQKSMLEKFSPAEILAGQKIFEKSAPVRFNMVTVLYASILGFSNIQESMDSQVIMDELDIILFEFDRILKKYDIQKIKTIGDTYMAAGGIPVKNMTNPIEVVMAALEIENFMNSFPVQQGRTEKVWEIRLGIHTGPVFASMSGKKKVNYDIKGDTVNIASRMETYSSNGQIIISAMTYELVKELFDCDYFGKMPVKYKGDLEMFTVKGLRDEFAFAGSRITPNAAFDTRFKLVQFTELQELILEKLEMELPPYLYYHNVKHTVDVVTEVELIGWTEDCSDEEILLLKTAGLFHDAGHTVTYDGHEHAGTEMARAMLPEYGYSQAQIDRICEIIMATKLPPQPKDLLQEIICDADLDYLGRSDMIPVSNTLYKELHEQNKIGSLNDWNKLQVKFISNHQYFTKTARSLREVNKQIQIERIKSLITEDPE
ncbi:MAG: HD domain-containing protein [Bacteroidales bacterium]|nr:HD domain-containing protein [Bacteroidales bacterium]